MAIDRILEREHEIAVQEEVTYGTDPGAVAAGDFFKAQLAPDAVQRAIARADRDQDRDFAQASVLSTQKGRESATITIPGDVIPSGNGTTPTEPDMDLLFKAVFGSKHKATAHTTTAAGSAGVSLNLTAGGVVVVEWGEKLPPYLRRGASTVRFHDLGEGSRRIEVIAEPKAPLKRSGDA